MTAEALWEWAVRRFPGLQISWTVMLAAPCARYCDGGLLLGGAQIEVDRRLRGPALICALAEEIGHHATMLYWDGPGRSEEHAFRWAASLLIPAGEAGRADDPAALAERYGVTEPFAARVLALGRVAAPAPRIRGPRGTAAG